MTTKPSTFLEALHAIGTRAEVASALGVPYVTAQMMFHRKSIGDAHWPRLIEVLASRGVSVTTDDLLAMKHGKRAGVAA